MSNINKQTVQAVADLKAGYTLGHADVELIQQMALDAVTLLDELEAAEKRIAEQSKTLMAARSYVKSHAAGDGHAFGVLQAIDRSAGIGVKGE